MAVVYYANYDDFISNVQELVGLIPAFSLIQAAISAERILNPEWEDIELNESEFNDTLNKLTSLVAALSPNVNCYPLGLVTTLCFDIDGNSLP